MRYENAIANAIFNAVDVVAIIIIDNSIEMPSFTSISNLISYVIIAPN